MPSISISKSYSFDASHQLYNPEWSAEQNGVIFGKCARQHGHTYKLTVEVTGDVDPDTGMVLNYFDLDKIVKPIVYGEVNGLDHFDLNEVFAPMLTTAENMAEVIAKRIGLYLPEDVILLSVTLSETPKTTARWTSY